MDLKFYIINKRDSNKIYTFFKIKSIVYYFEFQVFATILYKTTVIYEYQS